MFAIFAISAGLTYTLGRHDRVAPARLGGLGGDGVSVPGRRDHRVLGRGARQSACSRRRRPDGRRAAPGGNMEGKEVRFGIANSALFATVTTDACCGAVNAMHDSFTPLGGLVPLVNIMLGEVIFGGVGAGLYGMLIFVVLAVFIAGLMVGRTPEYLGKKIEAYDVQDGDAGGAGLPADDPGVHRHLAGLAGVRHLEHRQPGPARPVRDPLRLHLGHGQQRVGVRRPVGQHALVQHDASASRCSSALLRSSSRCWRIAGSLGRKKRVPPSPGTFPVTTPLFAALLVSVIVIVGALTFFPALSLGPDRRALPDARRADVLMSRSWQQRRHSASGTRTIVRGALVDALRKLNPRTMARNPVMFVVEVGSVLTTVLLVRDIVAGRREHRVRAADHVLALAHGAVRQLRRGDGRGARQGAGRHAAQARRPRRRRNRLAAGRRRSRSVAAAPLCAKATSCWSTRASSSRPTAKSSKASRRWTNRRSPANRRR